MEPSDFFHWQSPYKLRDLPGVQGRNFVIQSWSISNPQYTGASYGRLGDFSKGATKMISPGRVFAEIPDDVTHLHQFHQIEGLVADGSYFHGKCKERYSWLYRNRLSRWGRQSSRTAGNGGPHPSAGHSSGTLVNALMYHIKDLSGINGVLRPGIAHRIDKDTSGLPLRLQNDQAHVALADEPKDKKSYASITIVHGNLPNDRGVIEAPIGRSEKDRKKQPVTAKGKLGCISNSTIAVICLTWPLKNLFFRVGIMRISWWSHPLELQFCVLIDFIELGTAQKSMLFLVKRRTKNEIQDSLCLLSR